MSELRESEVPALITEYGKPVAYLIGVESYEFMQRLLSILEGIVRRERAILENRIFAGRRPGQFEEVARVIWTEPAPNS